MRASPGLMLLALCSCATRGGGDATVRFGRIDGYVQIPAGGNPGTTSRNRPTFRALGISEAVSPELRAQIEWDRHSAFARGRLTRLSGSSTLSETLITRNVEFPAGTHIRSDVKLDWYRLGYRYRFGGPELSVAAGVGAGLLDFSYEIRGGIDAREFSLGVPIAEVVAEWNPPGDVSVAAEFAVAPPIASPRVWYSGELTIRIRLWEGGRWIIGGTAERFDFRDRQEVPNHIRADLGPGITTGFELRF